MGFMISRAELDDLDIDGRIIQFGWVYWVSDPNSTPEYGWYVDDVVFCTDLPTPTPTVTITSTRTRTLTPTLT
jgi:hypothetical protein